MHTALFASVTQLIHLDTKGGFREKNTVLWTRSNEKWPEGVVGTIVGDAKKPTRMMVQVGDKKFSILKTELRPAIPKTEEAALAVGFTQAQIKAHLSSLEKTKAKEISKDCSELALCIFCLGFIQTHCGIKLKPFTLSLLKPMITLHLCFERKPKLNQLMSSLPLPHQTSRKL